MIKSLVALLLTLVLTLPALAQRRNESGTTARGEVPYSRVATKDEKTLKKEAAAKQREVGKQMQAAQRQEQANDRGRKRKKKGGSDCGCPGAQKKNRKRR